MNPFYLQLMGVCEEIDSCHWITPCLSIGNSMSSYVPFQVVVNANFPSNCISHKKCGRREEQMGASKCTLYVVGLGDADSEIANLEKCIDHLIPRLRIKYNEHPEYKFLFHCYAGKCRSVALALAFMVEVLGMKFTDALELIKEKRPCVKPRQLFIETLRKRYETLYDS
jgi:hypothetical protein